MELYYSAISAFSHKVKMAFAEKGVDYKPVLINLADLSQREEYRSVYPLGKVPYLVVGNEGIGESANIIEWLDNHYQVNKLIPEKAEEARVARYWERVADAYLIQNAIMLFFQSQKPEIQQDQERIAIARRQIQTLYTMLEAHLVKTGKEFVVSDHFSVGDIALACGLVVSQLFCGVDEFPNVQRYFGRLAARESFAIAREGFEDAVADMVKFLTAA